MATRATFRLPPSIDDVHQWIKDNFPGADVRGGVERTKGAVIVTVEQDLSAGAKTAAEAAVIAAWTEITWESIP